MSKTLLRNTDPYKAWVDMKLSCYEPSHYSYKYRGAVGVTVCDEWKNSFHKFIEDMPNRKPEMKSIKLKRGCSVFEKGSCEWTSKRKFKKKSAVKSVSFLLDERYHSYIAHQARLRSIELKTKYTVSDMIRDVLKKAIPFPETLDMFGDEL